MWQEQFYVSCSLGSKFWQLFFKRVTEQRLWYRNQYGGSVEWQWLGESKVLDRNLSFTTRLAWDQTQMPAGTGRWLTPRVMIWLNTGYFVLRRTEHCGRGWPLLFISNPSNYIAGSGSQLGQLPDSTPSSRTTRVSEQETSPLDCRHGSRDHR